MPLALQETTARCATGKKLVFREMHVRRVAIYWTGTGDDVSTKVFLTQGKGTCRQKLQSDRSTPEVHILLAVRGPQMIKDQMKNAMLHATAHARLQVGSIMLPSTSPGSNAAHPSSSLARREVTRRLVRLSPSDSARELLARDAQRSAQLACMPSSDASQQAAPSSHRLYQHGEVSRLSPNDSARELRAQSSQQVSPSHLTPGSAQNPPARNMSQLRRDAFTRDSARDLSSHHHQPHDGPQMRDESLPAPEQDSSYDMTTDRQNHRYHAVASNSLQSTYSSTPEHSHADIDSSNTPQRLPADTLLALSPAALTFHSNHSIAWPEQAHQGSIESRQHASSGHQMQAIQNMHSHHAAGSSSDNLGGLVSRSDSASSTRIPGQSQGASPDRAPHQQNAAGSSQDHSRGLLSRSDSASSTRTPGQSQDASPEAVQLLLPSSANEQPPHSGPSCADPAFPLAG